MLPRACLEDSHHTLLVLKAVQNSALYQTIFDFLNIHLKHICCSYYHSNYKDFKIFPLWKGKKIQLCTWGTEMANSILLVSISKLQDCLWWGEISLVGGYFSLARFCSLFVTLMCVWTSYPPLLLLQISQPVWHEWPRDFHYPIKAFKTSLNFCPPFFSTPLPHPHPPTPPVKTRPNYSQLVVKLGWSSQ